MMDEQEENRHFENVKFLLDRFEEVSKEFTNLDFGEGATLPKGIMLPIQDYTAIVIEFMRLGAETFATMKEEVTGESYAEYLMELGTAREMLLRSLGLTKTEEETEDED